MFKWVKAHAGLPGNEAVDALAKQGVDMTSSEHTIRTLPTAFLLPGARLSRLTLKIICRGLREVRDVKERDSMVRVLTLVQNAIDDRFRFTPTVASVWNNLKSRDLSKNVRVWMWKTMHDSFWLGKKWCHVPNCEDRIECTYCGCEETMSHVLCECMIPGQREV